MYEPKVEPWHPQPYKLRPGAYARNESGEEVDIGDLFLPEKHTIRWSLKGWELYGIEFEACDFVGTKFADCIIDSCRFNRCYFVQTSFHVSTLIRAAFTHSTFRHVDFTYCTFAENNLIDNCTMNDIIVANVANCELNISNTFMHAVSMKSLHMQGSIYGCHIEGPDCMISMSSLKEVQFHEFTNFRLGPGMEIVGEHSWVPAMFDALPDVPPNDLWKLLKEAPKDDIERQRWLTELVLERGPKL